MRKAQVVQVPVESDKRSEPWPVQEDLLSPLEGLSHIELLDLQQSTRELLAHSGVLLPYGEESLEYLPPEQRETQEAFRTVVRTRMNEGFDIETAIRSAQIDFLIENPDGSIPPAQTDWVWPGDQG